MLRLNSLRLNIQSISNQNLPTNAEIVFSRVNKKKTISRFKAKKQTTVLCDFYFQYTRAKHKKCVCVCVCVFSKIVLVKEFKQKYIQISYVLAKLSLSYPKIKRMRSKNVRIYYTEKSVVQK